jgi:hypothetical protein
MKNGTGMSDLETTVDQRLAAGLEQFRKVAESEKGHRMGAWHFQDSETGYLIVARCSQCGAPAKIKFGEPTDLASFPAETLVVASAALEFSCINPRQVQADSAVAAEGRPSDKSGKSRGAAR